MFLWVKVGRGYRQAKQFKACQPREHALIKADRRGIGDVEQPV
jgi:hypothetical protein